MGKSVGSRKQPPEKARKTRETGEKKKKPVKQESKNRSKDSSKKRPPSSSSVGKSSSSSSSESEIDDQWVLQTEQVAGTLGLILGSIHIFFLVCPFNKLSLEPT